MNNSVWCSCESCLSKAQSGVRVSANFVLWGAQQRTSKQTQLCEQHVRGETRVSIISARVPRKHCKEQNPH